MIKKIILKMTSIVTMTALCFTSLSVMATAAEEQEKLYTLAELVEMSDQEFLAIDANVCYEMTSKAVKQSGNHLTGTFQANVSGSDSKYVETETESKINELLGESVSYTYTLPNINSDTPIYFDWIYSIQIADTYTSEVSNENIMLNAKILYCLNQVLDFGVYIAGTTIYTPYLTGDMNNDQKVTAEDAAILFEYIQKVYRNEDVTPLNSVQQKNADINNDGKFTFYDVSKIFSYYKEAYKNGSAKW